MSNNITSQPSAYRIYKIDLALPQTKLISHIQEILNETQSHKATVMNENFWNWQYVNTPGKHSCVYVAEMNDQIVGYYHVPIYEGKIAGQDGLIAMIQDVAIHPAARGKGLFTKLATYANQDIDTQKIEACYTFPNHKSIHTFLKYNDYTIIDVLKSYILWIDTRILLRKKLKIPLINDALGYILNLFLKIPQKQKTESIQEIENFDTSVERLYQTYLQQYSNYVIRNVEYLTWRYKMRPYSTYFTLGYYEANNLTAVAIFKIDTMFKVPVLLLMDYAFTDIKHFFELIQHAPTISQKYSAGEKVAFIFAAMCDKHFIGQKKPFFFLPVPKWMNPRKLHLLTRPVQNSHYDIIKDSQKWFVTLGDWDVF
ncbi:MAG: GNAT family N-acetyltransferase [Bacteroidia bacterium]|nr:GNAT family N-acetyltransferase [Bacteroidia bacterium]MDW8301876.1 GNAT family N-acetyltransferase [Bacteroidia bacterium]